MNRKIKNTLIAIGIPVVYAMLVRIIFGMKLESWDDFFSVMSTTFLFILPTIIGALTVYLSSQEKAKNIAYRIFTPWIPILIFLVLTLALAIEGWACWLMILPVFLLTASIGGLFGGYLKTQKRNDRLNVSILVLIPFLLGPIESLNYSWNI